MPRLSTRASSPMTNDHGKATEAYEEVVPEAADDAQPTAPASPEEPDESALRGRASRARW